MKSAKLFAVAAVLVAVGGVIWISVGNLGENLVYYWTPSEMHAHAASAGGAPILATIRLGGMVKAGSIVKPSSGSNALSFVVTDATDSVTVHSTAIPPAMFREGIGVVVEGTVAADGSFESKRLMVKHDASYKAPADGAMPDEAAMFGTLSDAAAEPEPSLPAGGS